MYLQLSLSRKPFPDQADCRPPDAAAAILRVHVKLCDLPGPPCRFRRSDERESDDGTVTPNQEGIPTGLVEVRVEVRVVVRPCGADRNLAVQCEFPKLAVEQADQNRAIAA